MQQQQLIKTRTTATNSSDNDISCAQCRANIPALIATCSTLLPSGSWQQQQQQQQCNNSNDSVKLAKLNKKFDWTA